MENEAAAERKRRAAIYDPPTDRQIVAVRKFYGSSAVEHLTHSGASRLLSVRDYVLAVAHHAFSKRGVMVTEAQIQISAWEVASNSNLVYFIAEWNKRRLAQHGDLGIPARLRETHQMVTVAEIISENMRSVDW